MQIITMVFCSFFQWTAVLIGAVTSVCIVGVVLFLLYRKYKHSSQCSAHCTSCSERTYKTDHCANVQIHPKYTSLCFREVAVQAVNNVY